MYSYHNITVSFFKIHDVDSFYKVETQIIKYSDDCPNIFVLVTLCKNCLINYLNDFVQNDLLHDIILDRVGEMFVSFLTRLYQTRIILILEPMTMEQHSSTCVKLVVSNFLTATI